MHTGLVEIFDCGTDQPFAGISILVCGDCYQLPPATGTNLLTYDL